MYRADVITLIGEDPRERGMWDEYSPIERKVFVEVGSVGMSETYEARSVGLSPELRFVIRIAEDYRNERRLRYKDVEYKIVRTYMSGDGIELYAERMTGDV